VIGTSSYSRADGSSGAVADVVFGVTAAQRAAAQSSSTALTSSLVAAGLVATAGAAAQAAAAETSVSATLYEPTLQAPTLLDHSALPTVDGARLEGASKLAPADIAAPIRANGSHAEAAPASAGLDADVEVSAAARPAAAEAPESGPAGLIDHSALPVAAPMVDASAALLLAPAETLAAVVAEALPQAANGPDIDALLSGLPQSDTVPTAANVASFDQPFDAAAFNINAFMDANMITQDAVMSTAQA
jgi:large repetitive protein